MNRKTALYLCGSIPLSCGFLPATCDSVPSTSTPKGMVTYWRVPHGQGAMSQAPQWGVGRRGRGTQGRHTNLTPRTTCHNMFKNLAGWLNRPVCVTYGGATTVKLIPSESCGRTGMLLDSTQDVHYKAGKQYTALTPELTLQKFLQKTLLKNWNYAGGE